MSRERLVRAGCFCAVTAICASAALGQGRARRISGCNGQTISAIDVQTLPPFEPGGSSISARAARAATQLHSTTRESVVRGFLVFHVGEPCSSMRLLESERILRAQPFIANANIVSIPDGRGGVTISVVTSDETSLVADGTLTTRRPMIRAARLGDQNIGGTGISVTGAWRHGTLYRDVYRANITDYQFLGRPYQLSLDGTRNEVGGSWSAVATHPFFTDLQRTAWRASAGALNGYVRFLRPESDAGVALRFGRSYADAGVVRALGRVGHVFLVGGTLSRESERPGYEPVLITDSAIVPDTSTALRGRYSQHQSSRANLLLGFRNIRFTRVAGFDAVEGIQDLRTGVELSTLFGRGFELTPRDERDYFLSADLYAGIGSARSFGAFQVLTERRRDLEKHSWDGILASGRAAWYAHAAPRHTSLIDVAFSGGWRQRVPFQVTFAERDGGLRGYHASDAGGAQRLIMRLEQRYQLGHVRQFASVAGALFVDAGNLWAGDSPFGVTTGTRYAVGVGLLAALPPRSRRTWRVDLAIPVNARGDAGRYELRVSSHDFTRWFWREPGDIQTSRERSIPTSVFNWP